MVHINGSYKSQRQKRCRQGKENASPFCYLNNKFVILYHSDIAKVIWVVRLNKNLETTLVDTGIFHQGKTVGTTQTSRNTSKNYARMRVLSDPYFPVISRIFPYFPVFSPCTFCPSTDIYESEKTCILA